MKKIFFGLFLASTALFSSAQAAVLPTNSVLDSGFEQPATGGGFYGFTGLNGNYSGWNFAGNVGVASNGSAFNVSGATGSQAAFLKADGLPNSSISQAFNFVGSQFSVNFLAESRAYQAGGNPFSVFLDNTLLKFSGATLLLPTTFNSFSLYQSDFITASPGAHTLQFVGYGIGGVTDVTTFIDEVRIKAVPEPASIALLGVGLLGLAARRRAIKK